MIIISWIIHVFQGCIFGLFKNGGTLFKVYENILDFKQVYLVFYCLRYDFYSIFISIQGSPFKLTGTFDGYYYKKYKSYKNFWYGDGKVILLEFRICPIFIDLTQIEGYRTDWSRFGCFVLRVTSNFEAVWGQYRPRIFYCVIIIQIL